jgi:hypothetical protein
MSLRLLFFLLLGLFLLGASWGNTHRRPTVRICTIGDVITKETGYVDMLRNELVYRYKTINVARENTRAADWNIFFVYRTVQEKMPCHIVTILIGTHDATTGTTAQRYSNSIATLYNNLIADDVQRVIVLTPPPNPIGDNATAQRLQAYNIALGALETQARARLNVVDLQSILSVNTDFRFGTSRPNTSGHRKISNATVDSIRFPPGPEEPDRIVIPPLSPTPP